MGVDFLFVDEAHNFLAPPKQFARAYAYLREAIMRTKTCKVALLTATPIYRSASDLTRLVNTLKGPGEARLPETDAELHKRFGTSTPGALDGAALRRELQGYVSYYTTGGGILQP